MSAPGYRIAMQAVALGCKRHPPSGSVEQTETAKESADVVVAQKVSVKLAQSSLVAQPGVQKSPWAVEIQAFG